MEQGVCDRRNIDSRDLSSSDGKEDTWDVDRVLSAPVWIVVVNLDCWFDRIYNSHGNKPECVYESVSGQL